MKGIKSFCNHLEKPRAFALHSSPTKILFHVCKMVKNQVHLEWTNNFIDY